MLKWYKSWCNLRFFAFPSTCPIPPTSAVPSFLPSTFCVLQWPSLPSLSSLLCFIKCSTSASLTDRGCSSLGRGDGRGEGRGGKAPLNKGDSTNTERCFLPEVNPTHPLLGQQIKMRSLTQFSERTLIPPCTPRVSFQKTELKCIAQVHHNLDWTSKMGD